MNIDKHNQLRSVDIDFCHPPARSKFGFRMVWVGGRRCLCNVEFGASSLMTAWHPSKLLSTSIFWMIFVSGSWKMQQSFSFFNMFGWLPVVCCCRWSAWRSPSHSYEIGGSQSFPNPHSRQWHRVPSGTMGPCSGSALSLKVGFPNPFAH